MNSKKNKVYTSINALLDKLHIADGMTISFHHHLRNGDKVLNLVMTAIASRNIKDIHIAPSGIFPCHEPLVEMMKNQTVTAITTSTFNPGPVPQAISRGVLKNPVRLMTHGGRARAIEQGDLHIDIAFIAAPTSDCEGNLNGTNGPSACGYLSYAYADALCADVVVAVCDNLVDYPAYPIEIPENRIDYILLTDSIGDPAGIVSGTTKVTSDPTKLLIADQTAELIAELGMIKNGFSFQTGASSTSLAVAEKVKRIMQQNHVVGSFALGGIHAYLVQMLQDGLFKALMDTQSFDLESIASTRMNKNHIGISASQYASPAAKSCLVDKLDVVILGATEIDENFNVNVITNSAGTIIGASGGHSDCAAGSSLAIVVSNLTKKQYSTVKKRVTTITTPGDTIDAFVTEYGIAVNPRRTDLLNKLKNTSLNLVSISKLREKALSLGAVDARPQTSNRTIGFVEYRDGTIIDTIKAITD